MSLFENEAYHWRETYFVLFDSAKRPDAKKVAAALKSLRGHYEITDVRGDEETGKIESLTLISPADYAAMDISYVQGEDVYEHTAELVNELKSTVATAEERAKLKRLPLCDARFDVYHFEQKVGNLAAASEEEEDEFLDPGALLIVLTKLADQCDGLAIDPQSGTFL